MSNEPQRTQEDKKPLSGPKKRTARRSRSTMRVSGYRPKARNALYRLAQEYRHRHSLATAAEAWQHLAAVAAIGAHDVVLAHDPDTDTITYRPDIAKIATRSIKFASFASRLSRLA